MEASNSRCGYVALVGRPNVGKSTLLNRILGQKLSITSRKPQTTRHQILGIKTDDELQVIYVDTPGLHNDSKGNALNRYMNKAASEALRHVDLVVFLVDRTAWTDEDEIVLEKLKHHGSQFPAVFTHKCGLDKSLVDTMNARFSRRYQMSTFRSELKQIACFRSVNMRNVEHARG